MTSASPRREAPDLAHFAPRLHANARNLIGPKLRPYVAPSDLLQETLLVACEKLTAIAGRERGEVLAWLMRVMRYRLLNHLRKHRRELKSELRLPPGSGPAASSREALGQLVLAEIRAGLFAAVDALPEMERMVVEALYKEKETVSEVAHRLGKTEGAVRAVHHRAVKRLRRKLSDRVCE